MKTTYKILVKGVIAFKVYQTYEEARKAMLTTAGQAMILKIK